ncbi:MAG: hypothetical protein VYD48_00430 [Bacteroidota bacterium]|nr:hypothetical protein [Bacteroidota bacterium]
MYKKLGFIFSTVIIISCSSKKEPVISLKPIKAKYNILYNGNLFLDEGVKKLEDLYYENYWGVLPPIVRNNVLELESDYPTKNFTRSEEKAIKVIQRFGNDNNIDSDYINNAYLLLGKSRFYDKRFISSLQAFNYITKQENTSNVWYEATFWKALINSNLGQKSLAISIIDKAINKKSISNENKSKLYLAKSEINHTYKDYDSLIFNLKKSIAFSKDKNQNARSSFIIGQVYMDRDFKDSAKVYFAKTISLHKNKGSGLVINSKLFNLNLNKTSNEKDFSKLSSDLRSFGQVPRINFYSAKKLLQINEDDKAKKLLKQAIRINEKDKNLFTNAYNELYLTELKNKNYLSSSNYLDTLITYYDPNSKSYLILNDQRDKLNLIADLVKQNKEIDSLIYMSQFSDAEINLIINKENKSNSSEEKNINYSSQNISSFYFENNLAVQNGKRIFLIKWGNRSNVDNWRTNAVGSLNTGLQNENKQNPVKEIKSYDNLPRSPIEKDSLKNISNENFSKLGLYLYEYFNDKTSSEEVLSKVELKGKVGVKEFLQSKYYLYQIYSSNELNDPKKALEIKNFINSKYPSSQFAKFLRNQQLKTLPENTKDSLLDHIKEKTALNKYSLALNTIDSLMNVSASRDFRFNLYEQKLTIFGRIYKLERYLEELKNISVLYPEKAEFFSKKVEYVQNIIEKNKVLYKDNEYVLVYTDIEDSESQLTKKYDFVKEPYKNNVYLTVKYGFLNIEEAEKFADSITQNKKILSNNKYFVFSTAQYINMLIFKTLDIIKN